TVRNPLYHWTHLELQRYFEIHDQLSEENADLIYDQATASLNQPEMAVHGLLQRMNVETICTTDDPIDDLSHHRAYSEKPANFQMFPAFRPDKAMSVENSVTFNAYV